MQEFRLCVLEAYQPLLQGGGFQELVRRQGEFVNEYSVRIGNATTVIEVEGIGYGSSAWTKLFRASDADIEYYGLPINALLDQRCALPSKKKRRRERLCQDDQVRQDAAAIMEYAQDVLAGDFSALDVIIQQQREEQRQREARAPSPEQKNVNISCTEAGHAFKCRDYQKVVTLLGPHLPLLPKSQVKRYNIALEHLGEG